MAENLDITATAQALAAGACSATEILDRALGRIEQHQQDLNVFVHVDAESARRAAQASDQRRRQDAPLSLLDGIPVALKDNIHVDGFTTRNGTALSFPFTEEAVVAQKLRAAGAVLLGKLNMDECALGAITDNPHHGRTHNPWRIGYTAGGSSGGAGAAVASGMVMAALGTDTLGSVRLPAAYCGVVGLKPTHASVSSQGVVPLCPAFDDVGLLCRTVRDVELLFNVLAETAPAVRSNEGNSVNDLSGLRIGVLARTEPALLTPEVATGFEHALASLRAHGATLDAVSMAELNLAELRRHAFLIIEHDGAEALAEPLRSHPDAFSDSVRAMFDYGRHAPKEKLDAARANLDDIKAAATHVFERADLLVSPTAPQNAFPLEGPTPTNQADFTALANVCGWPAISLPSGLDPNGLPQAVQLMGPAHQEAQLLGIASFLAGVWGSFSPTVGCGS